MKWLLKRLHLLISLFIVVPTALIYGSPFISTQLDIQVETIDLANQLKAVAGLYLGIAIVWALGIWRPNYWKIATQLNVLFMLSLAAGRLLSMFLDGMPSGGYVFGVSAEVFLGLFSLFQLKHYAGDSLGGLTPAPPGSGKK